MIGMVQVLPEVGVLPCFLASGSTYPLDKENSDG